MNIKDEIINYIMCNEQCGALLVTGKWGCGKTHLLRCIADTINNSNNRLVAMISLFGIDSAETFRLKVKESVVYAQFSNIKEKSKREFFSIQRLGAKLTSSLKEYLPLAKCANAVFSINLLDFVNVEKDILCFTKDIKKGEIPKKELVLVFDDFERCGISEKKVLLGLINDYSENRKIKTIVIADEDKICDEGYSEFKEKAISRTLKMSSDYSDIIIGMISTYNETTKGYKHFIEQNSSIVVTAFIDSKCENLRTVKSILLDFERIYSAWAESNISMDEISSILYRFCAVFTEHRAGNYIDSIIRGFYSTSDEIQNKYVKDTFKNFPKSLENWICTGEWCKSDFIDEIERRYKPIDLSEEEKFFRYDFWDMDQKVISNGLPAALKKAYRGEATCDELIMLLKKIHALKEYDVDLQCRVDYNKINIAFEKRISKIRSGDINEPQKRTFTTNDQIDNEAKPINDKIESLSDRRYMWIGYSKFVSYLNGNSDISRYDLRNSSIDVFDDTLLQLFMDTYESSPNGLRRELSLVLVRLEMNNSYSGDSEVKKTIQNLKKLAERLRELSEFETDQMSLVILREFKKEIYNKIGDIQKTII